jgi:hypothetical protein
LTGTIRNDRYLSDFGPLIDALPRRVKSFSPAAVYANRNNNLIEPKIGVSLLKPPKKIPKLTNQKIPKCFRRNFLKAPREISKKNWRHNVIKIFAAFHLQS